MPLEKHSAQDAFEIFKGNEYSNWPERNSMHDRFAEQASPEFSAGIQLNPGEKVFTIGSCFARNVERELSTLGFDIPMRSFEVDKKYWGGEPTTLLNNYVVGAVIPQINWAFGQGEPFSIENNCASIGKKFKDLLIAGNTRPMEKEDVLDQRERINEIYRQLSDTRVVILTLGLIEAWWDKKAQIYINTAPPKQAVRAEPDRFELHVLEYEDVLKDLQLLAKMLKKHCLDGFHLVLTVSPVPLTSTFRDADIAVANSYSKAVLRAAAEKLVLENEFVSYFPSYESFMLTAKSIAFAVDQVHPSPQLVAHNISRLVQAYTGQDQETPNFFINRSAALVRENQKEDAANVLIEGLEAFPQSGELRTRLAELYFKQKQPDLSLQTLDNASTNTIAEAWLLKSKIAYKAQEFESALNHAKSATELWPAYKAGLFNLALAQIELGQLDDAEKSAKKLTAHSQISIWRSNVFFLQGLINEKQGHVERALEQFKRGASYNETRHIKEALQRVSPKPSKSRKILTRLRSLLSS